MTMTIDTRAKWLSIAVLVVGLAVSLAKAAPTILSDQQLLDWAHDTYERQDWIYASVHINALIQRNPPILRSNPALANSLEQGLDFAIKQLQENKRLADASRNNAGNAQGVGVVRSGLTASPPKVAWPR